jgi:hypothetical protein
VPLKKGRPSFLKKRSKKLFYAGPEAVAATTPMPQITKVFLLLFLLKKEVLP